MLNIMIYSDKKFGIIMLKILVILYGLNGWVMTQQAKIIAELQKNILLMQGFRPASLNAADNGGLSLIKEAFPNQSFPLGAIHEFVCSGAEGYSASSGFVAGIMSSLMKQTGVAVWIGSGNNIFPHALHSFGIAPHQVIFVEAATEKQKLWITEEALKCDALSAVIGDISQLGFTESRRFQLAVEQSGVTGFLLRKNKKDITNCSVTRWEVLPASTGIASELPGLGFPRWDVQLLKVRNGKPGSWQLEWRQGRFHHTEIPAVQTQQPLRRAV